MQQKSDSVVVEAGHKFENDRVTPGTRNKPKHECGVVGATTAGAEQFEALIQRTPVMEAALKTAPLTHSLLCH